MLRTVSVQEKVDVTAAHPACMLSSRRVVTGQLGLDIGQLVQHGSREVTYTPTLVAGREQGDVEDGCGILAMFNHPDGVDVVAESHPRQLVVIDDAGQCIRSVALENEEAQEVGAGDWPSRHVEWWSMIPGRHP